MWGLKQLLLHSGVWVLVAFTVSSHFSNWAIVVVDIVSIQPFVIH
jgi:hypothetical protein